MDVIRVSDPITTEQKLEVVSIADAKQQMRVLESDDDDYIAFLIGVAYDVLSGPNQWLNGYCLLEETFEVAAASLGRDGNELPLRPLSGNTVLSFETRTGSEYIAVPSTSFAVSVVNQVPILSRVGFMSWPYVTPNDPQAFRITFKAGHPDADAVPSPLKLAIRMLVATWYGQREAVDFSITSVRQGVRYGLESLCSPYRFHVDHS